MIIVGLGNPGEEFKNTRHNAGRMAVEAFAKKHDVDFDFDKKANALVGKGVIGKKKFTLVLPETFMNKSGESVKYFVKTLKVAEQDLIVVHDELAFGIGGAKMSYDKSSGGHKGVQSVMNHVKTEKFFRIRVGIVPTTPTGKLKKPDVEDIVDNFIVAPFKPKELEDLKPFLKKVVACLEMAVEDSPERAMSEYNAKW